MYGTERRKQIAALLALFLFVFSAFYLMLNTENSGNTFGMQEGACTWRTEHLPLKDPVSVEELSGVRSWMLRLFPGIKRHAEEKEAGIQTVTLAFLSILYFLLKLRFVRMTGKQAEACISLKEAVIRYIHRQDGQKDRQIRS